MLHRIFVYSIPWCIGASLCLGALNRTHAFSDDEDIFPTPGSAQIIQLSSEGEGCPPGTVLDSISPDGQVVTLLYSDFNIAKRAQENAGIQKTCRIRMTLARPPGWSYSALSFHLQGYADLEPHLAGTQELSLVYGPHSRSHTLNRLRIHGPFSDDFVRSTLDERPLSNWSSCDGNTTDLVLNSTLSIRPLGRPGQAASGMMTVNIMENALEGGRRDRMTQQINLVWKRCSKPGEERAKPAYLAVCPLQWTDVNNGQVIRQSLIRQRARAENLALNKAQQRAQRECGQGVKRRGRGAGIQCQWSASLCQVIKVPHQ